MDKKKWSIIWILLWISANIRWKDSKEEVNITKKKITTNGRWADMEVPSESFKGELGIQEPVILCEPQILTVNRWLAGIISFYFISDEGNSPRKWNEGWVLIFLCYILIPSSFSYVYYLVHHRRHQEKWIGVQERIHGGCHLHCCHGLYGSFIIALVFL